MACAVDCSRLFAALPPVLPSTAAQPRLLLGLRCSTARQDSRVGPVRFGCCSRVRVARRSPVLSPLLTTLGAGRALFPSREAALIWSLTCVTASVASVVSLVSRPSVTSVDSRHQSMWRSHRERHDTSHLNRLISSTSRDYYQIYVLYLAWTRSSPVRL